MPQTITPSFTRQWLEKFLCYYKIYTNVIIVCEKSDFYVGDNYRNLKPIWSFGIKSTKKSLALFGQFYTKNMVFALWNKTNGKD
jgi:hypothetical protein